MSNSRRLSAALRGRRPDMASLDLAPKSAHEAMTRAMVEDLGRDLERQRGETAADLAEVEGRVNTLIWVLIGAVALDLVGRAVGL